MLKLIQVGFVPAKISPLWNATVCSLVDALSAPVSEELALAFPPCLDSWKQLLPVVLHRFIERGFPFSPAVLPHYVARLLHIEMHTSMRG